MKIINIISKIFDNPWSIYFIFVILNATLAFFHPAPFVFPDEYGPIAIGNWIAGGQAWGFRPALYYGYTFSPFIAPFLILFDDIRYVYLGSLIVKAFKISLIPFFTYKILYEVFEVKKPLIRVLIPIVIGLFPSVVIYSKYLTNDSTLHVTLFICFYLIGKCACLDSCVERNIKLWIYSALLGFFAVFAYATHGMGLAFIVAIFMTIIATHIFTKRMLVKYPFFLGSFAVFFLIDRALKEMVKNAVFGTTGGGTRINTFEHSFEVMSNNLFEPKNIIYFFSTSFSRLYYSFASTFGFFQLSLIILGVFAFYFIKTNYSKKIHKDDKPCNLKSERVLFILAIFSFVIVGCGIGLSTLSNLGPVDGRFVFYGRYHDYMLLPMLIVGLYYIFCREIDKKTLLKYAIITMVSFILYSAWIHFFVIESAGSGAVVALFILGILPYLGASMDSISSFGAFPHSVILLTIVNIFVFCAAMFILFDAKKKRFIAIVLLAIMFAFGTYYGTVTTMMASSNQSYNNFFTGWEESQSVLEEFRDIHDEFPYLYIISNRIATLTANHNIIQSRGQLNFMDFTVIRTFRIDRWLEWQKVENAMIFSDRNLSTEEIGEGVIQIYEAHGVNIWIRGGEIIEFYRNRQRERI